MIKHEEIKQKIRKITFLVKNRSKNDLKKHLLSILQELNVLKMPLEQFKNHYEDIKTMFTKWEYVHRNFRDSMKTNRSDRNQKNMKLEMKIELIQRKICVDPQVSLDLDWPVEK